MRVARTVAQARAAVLPARAAGRSVALVPTMGALHAGHLSLVERAGRDCDEVVVSIFVNPSQFVAGEDYGAYPRDESADAALAAEAGASILFVPTVEEVYPTGFATTISVAGISEGLCGATRGAQHFSGVATVVVKLLNMVAPDAAYFGEKDAQQVAVIRRVVEDLNLPVRIEVAPTIREPDGLAMSSRNAYLTHEERSRAHALQRGLTAAEQAIAAGERSPQTIAEAGRRAMTALDVAPEYLELVDPQTLAPLTTVDGPVLIAVAARIGRARLIDNSTVSPPPPPSGARPRTGETPVSSGAPAPALINTSTPSGDSRRQNGAEQPCSA